jgi:hypothetical protein
MKRLFMLRRGKQGQPVRDDDHTILTFPTKSEAKRIRDSLGGDFVVSYGPDHRKFKGE